jgi:dTMP kinase
MFICFEGLAGTGKTTQVNLLIDFLKNHNKSVFLSSSLEADRKKAFENFIKGMDINADENALMFLFQSLHSKQYSEVSENLNKFDFIVADRWRYSFVAHHFVTNTFQGDTDLLSKIDSFTYKDLEPDICFMLNVPPEVAYERYLSRESKSQNILHLQDLNYFKKADSHYRELASDKNWIVVDGLMPESQILEEIVRSLPGI